jgi:hypothetical protein
MTKKEVTQLAYEITGYAIKEHKALGRFRTRSFGKYL